jgi:hypothetical protein
MQPTRRVPRGDASRQPRSERAERVLLDVPDEDVSLEDDMPLDEFVVSVEFRLEGPLVEPVPAVEPEVEPVPLAPMLVVSVLLPEAE